MATKTLLRNISGVGDVRAVLSSSTLCRKLSIGTDWTKIRIGLRYSFVDDTGASITSTPRFAIGVCSGTANPWNNGSGTTDHWVGLITASATWTRSTSPTIHYWLAAYSGSYPAKRVGTTLTLGDANLVYSNYVIPGTNYSQILAVDIQKPTTPETRILVSTFQTSNPSAASVTQAQLLAIMALSNPSGSLSGYAYNSSRWTPVVNEAVNGYLDSVNVAWDRADPKIEISDLAVARLA